MDSALRAAGMKGEGVTSGAVIAVKTHDFDRIGWSKKEWLWILKKIASIIGASLSEVSSARALPVCLYRTLTLNWNHFGN